MKITTIRIPCDGSPLEKTRVPFKTVYRDDYKYNYLELEKRLGIFPDTLECDKTGSFDWLSRSLIVISADHLDHDCDEEWRADYLMYTCLDKRCGTCAFRTNIST